MEEIDSCDIQCHRSVATHTFGHINATNSQVSIAPSYFSYGTYILFVVVFALLANLNWQQVACFVCRWQLVVADYYYIATYSITRDEGRQRAIEPDLLVGWVTASAIIPTACTCHSVHMSGCHFCYHWQMLNNLIYVQW